MTQVGETLAAGDLPSSAEGNGTGTGVPKEEEIGSSKKGLDLNIITTCGQEDAKKSTDQHIKKDTLSTPVVSDGGGEGVMEGLNKVIESVILQGPPVPESGSKEQIIPTTVSPTTGGRGSLSRRGTRGGRGSRGGRSGGRGSKKSGSYQNNLQDASDFNSSLFTMLQQPSSFVPLNSTRNYEIPAAAGYLSRDMMIQLTANVNSGFFYINNALELLKQSQLELFHVKNTLERVYRNQHGEFDTTGQSSDDLTSPGAVGGVHAQEGDEISERNQQRSSSEVNAETKHDPLSSPPPIAERFQVSIDPFQFMNYSGEYAPDPEGIPEFPVGRGGRTGGRGRPKAAKGTKRRRKQAQEYVSSYDSELAQKGIMNLIKYLKSSAGPSAALLNQQTGPTILDCIAADRQAVVVLHDLQEILAKKGENVLNRYSAAKIEASCKRKEADRANKMKKSTEVQQKSPPPVEDNDSSMEVDKPKEDDGESPKEQVSKISVPPANEENDVTSRKRKVPVTTNDSVTSSTDGDHPAKGGGKKLPHWRQLRVDPEVLARVKLRLHQQLQSSSQQQGKRSLSPQASPTKTKTMSDSPVVKSPLKKKIPKWDDGSRRNISTASAKSESNCKLGGIIPIKCDSSSVQSKSGITSIVRTPPDEEMLDLTPDKDHCDCITDNDAKAPSPEDNNSTSNTINSAEKNADKPRRPRKCTVLKKSSSDDSVATEILHTSVEQSSGRVVNGQVYNDSNTEKEPSPVTDTNASYSDDSSKSVQHNIDKNDEDSDKDEEDSESVQKDDSEEEEDTDKIEEDSTPVKKGSRVDDKDVHQEDDSEDEAGSVRRNHSFSYLNEEEEELDYDEDDDDDDDNSSLFELVIKPPKKKVT